MKRWTCPRPECGSTVLAPARPRQDDVRRYCLPCSATTGRLVVRVCRAAAHAQAERAVARRQAAAVDRDRAAHATAGYYTIGRVDLRPILRAACRAYVRLGYARLREVPSLRVVRRTLGRVLRQGYALHGEHRVVLNVYPDSDEPGVVETLVHELAHLAVGPRPRSHGVEFNRALTRAAAELWGIRVAVDYGRGGHMPCREIERRLRAIVTGTTETGAPSEFRA